ncbi:MAG TPA: CHASE3 domain-containing protein [Bacteroidia bacterium]|jgi:signal transduction histidine kinase|nr:CHASE3 domain-containing protein [Bacteroidia bacterium]
MSLRKKILAGFITCSAILLIIAFFSFKNTRSFTETNKWVNHTHEVLYEFEQTLQGSVDAQAGAWGYIVTGQEIYLAPFTAAEKNIFEHIRQVKDLTRDNPVQQKRIDTLEGFLTRHLNALDQRVEARRKNFESAKALIETGEGLNTQNAIRRIIGEAQKEEEKLLVERKSISEADTRNFNLIFTALLTLILLILIVVYYIISANLRALQKAEQEIKALNTDLSNNILKLHASNAELESFSYSVSHDLKAPLRVLNIFSQMLEEEHSHNLKGEALDLLKQIRSSATKMGVLINSLLELSLLGRKELKKSPVNMTELVENVLSDLQTDTPGKTQVHTDSLLPASADPSLLRQVWINLIGNAIKYSSNKENPTIEIGCRQSGNEVIYHVKDNGAGFNMKYADQLFGVFKRLHSYSEFEGNGIGLALVHRIITRHGGKVWAEAKEDEGATFYFSLPVGN